MNQIYFTEINELMLVYFFNSISIKLENRFTYRNHTHTHTQPPVQHTSLHFHLSASAAVLKQKAEIKFGLFMAGSHLLRLREGVFKRRCVSAAPRAEQSGGF